MRKILGCLFGAMVLISAPSFAHHSAVMFDENKEITVKGTVKEFQYTNPHSWLLVDVKNDDGTRHDLGLRGRRPEHAHARRHPQERLHARHGAHDHGSSDARRPTRRVVDQSHAWRRQGLRSAQRLRDQVVPRRALSRRRPEPVRLGPFFLREARVASRRRRWRRRQIRRTADRDVALRKRHANPGLRESGPRSAAARRSSRSGRRCARRRSRCGPRDRGRCRRSRRASSGTRARPARARCRTPLERRCRSRDARPCRTRRAPES